MQAIESKLKVNRERQEEKIKCKQQQSPQTQQVGPPAGNAVNEGAATSSVEQATSASGLPTIEGLKEAAMRGRRFSCALCEKRYAREVSY